MLRIGNLHVTLTSLPYWVSFDRTTVNYRLGLRKLSIEIEHGTDSRVTVYLPHDAFWSDGTRLTAEEFNVAKKRITAAIADLPAEPDLVEYGTEPPPTDTLYRLGKSGTTSSDVHKPPPSMETPPNPE